MMMKVDEDQYFQGQVVNTRGTFKEVKDICQKEIHIGQEITYTLKKLFR